MKDNYVILHEDYSPEGFYHIEINTHLGSFEGWTMPDETDAKYLSKFHASEIALAKALRKFAKAAITQLKLEIQMLEGMIKQACDFALSDEGDADVDIDNTSFRIMNGTLKQKKKELAKWQSRRAAISLNITNRVAARDRLVAKYIEKDKAE